LFALFLPLLSSCYFEFFNRGGASMERSQGAEWQVVINIFDGITWKTKAAAKNHHFTVIEIPTSDVGCILIVLRQGVIHGIRIL
jgi:hypothetical protein